MRTSSRARLPRPDAFAAPARHRQPLTREDLVRAGLEVLDEAGIDGLTMRSVAARLGVQSASLYWHVRDKDELLALIADAICAEIEPPLPDQPWIDQLVAMAWEYRRVLLAHRDARPRSSRTPVGPNRLGLAERMLSVLVQSGIAPGIAAKAGMLFTDYVTNAVIEEGRNRATTDAFAPDDGGAAPQGVGDWIASTSAPTEYPTLVALAADLTDTDAEARFRFGLDVLVAGLLAQGDDRWLPSRPWQPPTIELTRGSAPVTLIVALVSELPWSGRGRRRTVHGDLDGTGSAGAAQALVGPRHLDACTSSPRSRARPTRMPPPGGCSRTRRTSAPRSCRTTAREPATS